MAKSRTYLGPEAEPRTQVSDVDDVELIGLLPVTHMAVPGGAGEIIWIKDGVQYSNAAFTYDDTNYDLSLSPNTSITTLTEAVAGGSRVTSTHKAFVANGLEASLALRSRSATLDTADFTITVGTITMVGDYLGALTWNSQSVWHNGNLLNIGTTAGSARTALALGTAATQNTGTSGANLPFANGANTWATTQTFTVAPVFTDQSGSRTALGLGTAAVKNTGTSGDAVPLLNAANTWTTTQTIGVGGTGSTNAVMFLNGSSASSFGGYLAIQRNSVNKALIGTESAINGGASDDLFVYSTANIELWASAGKVAEVASTGLAVAGNILSSHATGGIGYATGAGGTVAQATNKSTAVTLNKATGTITMQATNITAGSTATFTFNNTAIAATDQIVMTHHSVGTFGSYTINCRATGAGTASVAVRNNTAGTLGEAIVLRFFVNKSVDA
jgi:hypothetical protein